MKSTIEKFVPKFQPVRVTLEFETQEELDAIAGVFNSGVLNDVTPHSIYQARLWDVLVRAGANLSSPEALKPLRMLTLKNPT